jgi:SWI/SNF-related matrix-associated actin-dependent regulator of chromatin subfamily A-like protein 1
MNKVYPKTMLKNAKAAINKKGHKCIVAKFPFDYETLNRVKSITGRSYVSESKHWEVPYNVMSIEKLVEFGFKIDDELFSMLHKTSTAIADLKEIEIPGLKGLLRRFQSIGVSFFDLKNGNALCCDDQGLGKTIETVAYLQLRKELRPVLLVVPAVAKINWQREAQKWMSPVPKVQILSGETPYKISGEIIIINYDILTYWVKPLIKFGLKIMIADEAQNIKNSSTKRTKAFKQIKKTIPKLLGLTGTPIENHPSEIYNIVNLIDPTLFPTFWDFAWEFCDPKNNGFGWQFNGATNIPKLHKILTESIMIRRLKKDVLPELPDKIISVVPIELTNQKEYDLAEQDFIKFVHNTKGAVAAERASNAQALAEIEGLKQIAIHGKLKGIIQWITDFLETGKKLVIGTTHTFVIDAIIKEFPDISLKLDGSVTGNNRQKVVDQFQTDTVYKLFIANIKSGGVAITLTAAWDEIIIELGWNPKLLDQFSDRIHRIGQTHGVNIYYLLALGTIEEKIAKLLDEKRKVIDGVIDGIETSQDSLLMELMKSYY